MHDKGCLGPLSSAEMLFKGIFALQHMQEYKTRGV
jgi:hypothetical protein